MKIFREMEPSNWLITLEQIGNKRTDLILPIHQYFPGEDLNFKNKKSVFNYKLLL